MNCRFCGTETDKLLEHVVECEMAPQEARKDVAEALASRKKYAEQPIICCKARKKVLITMVMMTEQACGIPDSEMADHMTFTEFRGRPTVAFKVCPWCGAPWKVQGIQVL